MAGVPPPTTTVPPPPELPAALPAPPSPPADLPIGYLQSAREWGEGGIADIEAYAALAVKYLPTSVAELDAALGGGLPARALTVMQGLPGHGKTSLMLGSAGRSALMGQPVLCCSYELSRMDALSRLAALNTGTCSWDECRSGRRIDAVRSTVEQLAPLPFYCVHDVGQSLSVLNRAMDIVAEREGRPPVLYIDYLQAMLTYGTGDARTETERLLRVLQAATGNGLTVVALSSVARGKLGKGDKPPSPSECLSAGKESGRIEYDASVHLTIALGSTVDGEGWRPGWIVISKHRYGLAPQSVPIRFHGPTGRIGPRTEITTALVQRKQQRDAELAAAVLDAIRRDTYSSADVLAQALGRRAQDVRQVLTSLTKAGSLLPRRKGNPYVAAP